jgi:hypothetical protein
MPSFVYDDGGRREAGYKGEARDCVVRAIAIASGLPYRRVYTDLQLRMPKGQSPRNGVERPVYDSYLRERGWQWTATMKVGSGCSTHLRADELPPGRLICRLSRHLAAVVDGQIHDTLDCSRVDPAASTASTANHQGLDTRPCACHT